MYMIRVLKTIPSANNEKLLARLLQDQTERKMYEGKTKSEFTASEAVKTAKDKDAKRVEEIEEVTKEKAEF